MKPLSVSPHALRQIYSSSDGILMTLILVAFVFPPLQISFVHPSLLGLPKEPLERDRFQMTRKKLMDLKTASFVLQTPVVVLILVYLHETLGPVRELDSDELGRKGWQVNQVQVNFDKSLLTCAAPGEAIYAAV